MNHDTRESTRHRPPHRRRRPARVGALIGACMLALAGAASAQDGSVPLRPGSASATGVPGMIETVGPGGIVVRSGEGPAARRTVIAWDRVRPPIDAFARDAALPGAMLTQLADDAWRARTRLERGDFQAAEPLLDRLAPSVIPAGGPTGAMTAHGLLMCRLSREARGSALFAWLDWLRIMRSGPGLSEAPAGSLVAPPATPTVVWEGGAVRPAVGSQPVDVTTGLVPGVPPIWVPGAALEALAASPEWSRFAEPADGPPGDPVLELAALYREAARAECGHPPSLPARASGFDGVRLVRDMLVARAGETAARATARDALAVRVTTPDAPRWMEAWSRAGIGRSLVIETDDVLRRRGVLQLLHLPARFARDQRHLAGIALAEAALTLADLGDAGAAATLRAELDSTFFDHPAARWPGLREAAVGGRGAAMGLPAGLVAMSIGALRAPQPPADALPEDLAEAGPDDALEAYLVRLNLPTLVAEHLKERLAALPRDKRAPVAERLAKLYVQLLEAATDAAARQAWEQKAQTLLREVPEADGFELRISLSRALYVRAEEACERWRLRLGAPEDMAEAERTLRQLEPAFREIAVKVHRRVEHLERVEKQGDGTDVLELQLADARRVRSLAFYYAGWCSYYIGLVTRSEPPAAEAVRSFGWLLNSPNGRAATLERLPSQLLRYEHVARAAVGCAMAASLRNNDVEAMRWIEAVEEADDVPEPVRRQMLLRKIAILGQGKRWSDLERVVRIARRSDRSGGGENVVPLEVMDARMLAVVTLEADRRVAGPVIDALARIALGDLVARGEVAHVLDLVDKFGTAPIGETGFIVHYVRGIKAYDDARTAHKAAGEDPDEPTRTDGAATLYRSAAALLSAAIAQDDAGQFRPERVRAALFAARATFFVGEFAPAADAFYRAWELASAHDRDSDDAEEALWLCVVALDRGAARPGAPTELARRRAQTSALFLQAFPESPRAARLLLLRATAGDISDEEALRVLEGVARGAPMYEAARRQVARILYARFRASTGSERDFAALRFIAVGEELLALDRKAATQVSGRDLEAARRAILRARQLLDALLGGSTPDADRAQSTLELLRTLAGVTGVDIAEYEPELVFRELQIALVRGNDAEAASLAERLAALPGSQREFAPAAERLLYRRAATLFREAATTDQRVRTAPHVVTFGVRVIDRLGADPADAAALSVYGAVAAAAFELWRASGGSESGGGDEAMRDLALRLDRAVLKAAPNTAESVRRVAVAAEAAGDLKAALDAWSLLLAAAPSGTDAWFEARFHALQLIARFEPSRARELLDQHRALFPTYGPAPWGDRIRALDESLSARPAAAPSAPAGGEGAR